jgi:hypothetical protein
LAIDDQFAQSEEKIRDMLGFLKLPRIILHFGKNPALEIAPRAQRGTV